MPFANTHNLPEVWEDVIRQRLFADDRFGRRYECVRADDIFDNTAIIEDIIREIERSSLIIADLTTRNPNVFYELGRAHALGKECILMAQTLEDVPFDLRHLKIIVYQTTRRGLEQLESSLAKTIEGNEARRQRPPLEPSMYKSALAKRAYEHPAVRSVLRRLAWFDIERKELESWVTQLPADYEGSTSGQPGLLARLHSEWGRDAEFDVSHYSFTEQRHGWRAASVQIGYSTHFGGEFGEFRCCFNSERFGFFVPVPADVWANPRTLSPAAPGFGDKLLRAAWERAWSYRKPATEVEMEREYERLRDGQPGVQRADGTLEYAIAEPGRAYLLRSIDRYCTCLVLLRVESLLDDASVIVRWIMLQHQPV